MRHSMFALKNFNHNMDKGVEESNKTFIGNYVTFYGTIKNSTLIITLKPIIDISLFMSINI